MILPLPGLEMEQLLALSTVCRIWVTQGRSLSSGASTGG